MEPENKNHVLLNIDKNYESLEGQYSLCHKKIHRKISLTLYNRIRLI